MSEGWYWVPDLYAQIVQKHFGVELPVMPRLHDSSLGSDSSNHEFRWPTERGSRGQGRHRPKVEFAHTLGNDRLCP